MTSVSTFVKGSLELIQVINPSQPVKAADMETGIAVLNQMMRRNEANGLALGWQPVESPQDVMPIPDEAEMPLQYQLAISLCPRYGVEPMAMVAAVGASLMNDLLRDQMVATPIQPILDCPTPDGWSNRTINGSTWYVG